MMFISMVLLNSCNREELITTVEPMTLDLAENLTPYGNSLILKFTTERSYECSNYEVKIAMQDTTGVLEIDLLGVLEPGVCIEQPEPARGYALYSSDPDTYEIRIKQQDRVSEGTLTVTNTRYLFNWINLESLTPVQLEMIKVPDQFYWGVLTRGTTNGTAEAEEFRQRLRNEGANLEPVLLEGEYGPFRVTSGGELVIDGLQLTPSDDLIMMYFPGGTEHLNDVLGDFTRHDFQVTFLTHDGYSINNQLL